MDVKTDKVTPIDDHINGLMKDSPDILYKLTRLATPKGKPIEFVVELPAVTNPDIIIGYVQRWREIQKHFDCELRVYAWSYTTEVEKYLLGCVQHMKNLTVTTLPMYLKEMKTYG